MRPPRRLLPLCLAGYALVAAAEKHAETLRCRAIAIGRAPAGEVYVQNRGAYQKITLTTDFITPSFRTDAAAGIRFFRKTTRPDPDHPKKSLTTYAAFCTCVPEGRSPRQLVLLTPGADDTWLAKARADTEADFPPGARLVFNLTRAPVAIRFGDTRLSIPPRSSALLPPATGATGGLAPIRMLRQTPAGAWIPFHSAVWRATDDERHLLFLYPVAGGEDPALVAIQDRVETQDAEEKKAAATR